MADLEKTSTIQLAPPAAATSSSGPLTCSSVDSLKKDDAGGTSFPQDVQVLSASEDDEDGASKPRRPGKIATVTFPAMAIVILAWWMTSLIVPTARHRWVVQTLWAWFFVLVIVFRFVPISVVTRPVSAVWSTTVASPLYKIPYRGRLALLWLATIAITFGTAFGFARPEGTAMGDRAISLAGVYFFQLCIYGLSHNRRAINWTRIPISIILQQILALLVLKSTAGFSIAKWVNAAVADFCNCAVLATGLIFDPATAGKGWFFASGLGVIIFLAAFVQTMYFLNWMQWLTKQFAWLGQKVFGASGAETFVAIWSPWFGQGNSAVLVGPYISSMTQAELLAIMTVSLSSLSSLVIKSFTLLPFPIPLRNLLAQSAIVIPGAIVNAKIAFPEMDPSKVDDDAAAAIKTDVTKGSDGTATNHANHETPKASIRPMTRSRESTCAARKKLNLRKAHDMVDSYTDGALVGIRVAGYVLANFFAFLALLFFVDGMLIWVFRGFGVHNLDFHQVLAGVLYPFVFFLGVPRHEVFSLAYVVAGKLLLGADFAYGALSAGMEAGVKGTGVAWSARGFAVMSMALGDTASLASLGIQVGVLTAYAPASRKTAICRGTIPALLVATLTSFQAAAIAASVL